MPQQRKTNYNKLSGLPYGVDSPRGLRAQMRLALQNDDSDMLDFVVVHSRERAKELRDRIRRGTDASTHEKQASQLEKLHAEAKRAQSKAGS